MKSKKKPATKQITSEMPPRKKRQSNLNIQIDANKLVCPREKANKKKSIPLTSFGWIHCRQNATIWTFCHDFCDVSTSYFKLSFCQWETDSLLLLFFVLCHYERSHCWCVLVCYFSLKKKISQLWLNGKLMVVALSRWKRYVNNILSNFMRKSLLCADPFFGYSISLFHFVPRRSRFQIVQCFFASVCCVYSKWFCTIAFTVTH